MVTATRPKKPNTQAAVRQLEQTVKRARGHSHNNMQEIIQKVANDEPLTFGQRIALTRNTVGMTQGQLAEKASINVTILSEYETGKRDVNGLKLGNILKVAQALNVSLDYLFGRE